MKRTALIVVVPEAEPHVAALRLAHDPAARKGVPAHVTVLFPFGEVDARELAELFAGVASFDFVLDRIERFGERVVWLHPEPSEPFVELTRAVWKRWPAHPPYGGAFETIIPHLTVSEEPLDVHVPLPIASRATAVTWIEEDANGRWSERARFPLGWTRIE